jgi:hypothetical protein
MSSPIARAERLWKCRMREYSEDTPCRQHAVGLANIDGTPAPSKPTRRPAGRAPD